MAVYSVEEWAMSDKATIDGMTMTQLRSVVRSIVEGLDQDDEVEDGRTLNEVFASIDAHMIHPKPDTPSLAAMLREDRDG